MTALWPLAAATKNMPACGIAIARMNRPSVFVYGGNYPANSAETLFRFRRVASCGRTVSDIELQEWKPPRFPGPGSCGGMYTANTMASFYGGVRTPLPNSSAQNASATPNGKTVTTQGGGAQLD
ncbi:MAG: hypothetical protein CM15mP120_06490 [Pseudomonadota bacterium]|nr:MAG: hypothetical protein CM15mP120_06490 [Pseudomonadota bacterium]